MTARIAISPLISALAVLAFASSAAAQFSYRPAGELVRGSGRGRADNHVYVPDMRFPLESGPAYANSQVWGRGGLHGGGGGQCDSDNYSFPWHDNYCETRGYSMPMCPAGVGHQGQDIRPGTCRDRTHWAVAVNDGTITHIGSYSVYLTDDSGRRFDYLHMRDVAVRVGQRVRRGDRLGTVSNNMGSTATTIHLHFNIRMGVSGYRGQIFVPPYMSLVRAYEGLSGEAAPEPAGGACHSAILGREVPEGACVQTQRERPLCGASGCAWMRCAAGAWECAELDACTEQHGNPECPDEPIPAGGASCHSSTLGRTVTHGTCVQTAAGRPECGLGGCAWFRCDDGAWQCTEPSMCEGDSHPNAGCGGGEPTPGGSGWLRSPLDGVRVTSHVTHTSGGRLVNFACDSMSRANHKGTDFGVATGSPVYAAAPGTVIRMTDGCPANGSLGSRCGGGFGNHVMIAHDNGHTTLYAHLTPRSGLPAVGTRVGCGDRLGLSGNSGSSTGPHLHFEVRRGTTVGAYFGAPPTDPYGGSCSSQPEHLWIGGSPGGTCEVVSGPRDDATFVSATHERTVRATPGTRVEQLITMRNSGTTTWTPDDYVFAHASGAFGELAEVELPEGSSIEPGDTVRFRVIVTAPSEAGEHRGEWRVKKRDGMHFGQSGRLTIEIAAEAGSCHSATLGRVVEEGTCVQVSYAGCGMSQCAWYACHDGGWTCTDVSACAGETYTNSACGEPVDCSSITECGACTDTPGCAYCRDTGACIDARDRGACTSRLSTPDECNTCKDEGAVCAVDQDCCGAADGGSMRCLLGFCTNVDGCGMQTEGCGSNSECCGAIFCAAESFGGESACCLRHDDPCASSAECCGEMQCRSGRCVCREVGEPCADHIDCCGGAYCDGGTCTLGS